jgi:hypothetical protein
VIAVHSCKRFSSALILLLLAVAGATGAVAQSALKTIDNPKGGKIVYGQVDGQTTEAGAMGAVLKSLHSQYGDKPVVDKVFQVRGTNSVAAFFTMVKKNQGNIQLAGMLIATRASAGHVEAALLTDEAARFGSTINPMLTTLFGVWHPGGEAHASQPAAPAGTRFPTVPPLSRCRRVGMCCPTVAWAQSSPKARMARQLRLAILT